MAFESSQDVICVTPNLLRRTVAYSDGQGWIDLQYLSHRRFFGADDP
jgi:hypothetical protein